MSTEADDRLLVRQRLEAQSAASRDLYKLMADPEALRKAAPILLQLLAEVGSPRIKADLVRAIASADVPPTPLVEELRRIAPELEKEPEPSKSLGSLSGADFIAELRRMRSQSSGTAALAWTLADALRELADPSVYEDLVELLKDKRLGGARQMLPYALANIESRRQDTIRTLIAFLNDEQIAPHVIDALRGMKAVEALPAIRPYLESANRLVRSEAGKAVKALENGPIASKPVGSGGSPRPPVQGLAEASTNFDLENVPGFLKEMALLLEDFGPHDISTIESALSEMEPDEERGFDFEVRHKGRKTPLQIRIYMSDVEAPDVAFFTNSDLAKAIDDLMDDIR